MQLGFWLVLVAIFAGMVSALLEPTRVMMAQLCMALCGMLLLLGAFDLGIHPLGLRHIVGHQGSELTISILFLAGTALEGACFYWVIKGVLQEFRQKRKGK